ncbi:hypothetical protein KIH27_10235 [Mycobacterium sp. M1]|uniref:Uncharacterized protein n=1 Tax=Mycolicibacter acidiphilus TaxID=2835306 RepID=A0ABS5RKE3_9MYCO|nr:hypothetical protein [Mycolicibacter acidiphilus]MBS9533961.1 hypothetical protein [Mycolicibacter acidiphilus]
MSYQTRPFIAAEPRAPGFHDARCRVTWTPRNAQSPPAGRILGDYLDADGPAGTVFLGCGVESALHDLGIDFVTYEHLVPIADLVSRQFAERPWAELWCPQGTARIELVPR